MARDPLTGFRLLRIGLNPPRAALYDRLNQRCAAMFAAGLRRGNAQSARPLRAGDDLRDAVIRYLKKHSPVAPAVEGRSVLGH